jgi:hypothetical protein
MHAIKLILTMMHLVVDLEYKVARGGHVSAFPKDSIDRSTHRPIHQSINQGMYEMRTKQRAGMVESVAFCIDVVRLLPSKLGSDEPLLTTGTVAEGTETEVNKVNFYTVRVNETSLLFGLNERRMSVEFNFVFSRCRRHIKVWLFRRALLLEFAFYLAVVFS